MSRGKDFLRQRLHLAFKCLLSYSAATGIFKEASSLPEVKLAGAPWPWVLEYNGVIFLGIFHQGVLIPVQPEKGSARTQDEEPLHRLACHTTSPLSVKF